MSFSGVGERGEEAVLDFCGRMRYNDRMNALTIKKIGNSAGVILPKELLAQLGTDVGGTLSVTRTPRGIELAASEASFDEQMTAMRQAMSQYKHALRELAK